MNRQTDGWTDKWKYGRTDRHKDMDGQSRHTYRRMDGQMGGQTDGRTDGRMDEQTYVRTEGQTDRCTDGRTDEQLYWTVGEQVIYVMRHFKNSA